VGPLTVVTDRTAEPAKTLPSVLLAVRDLAAASLETGQQSGRDGVSERDACPALIADVDDHLRNHGSVAPCSVSIAR
jgi:hypothetical protein